ncbi:MAG: isopenicillin N synthase-like dioxygenase, partial [Gammaproteobacteria bacterium]
MQVKDTATKIPVIDLRPLLSDEPGAYQQTVDSFFHAYSSLGFATIINHGISQSIVKAAFDASRRFHSLPEQSKRLIELNHLHRGYIPINTSTDVTTKLATVKKPNQSESFMMMREDNEDSPDVQSGAFLAGANQWPELCGFKEAVSSCHDALSELGHKLMGIACGAMDANPADVMPAFECPTTWFRLLRYPPVPEDPDGDLFGSAPHTDFGCLTILLQDDTGGLQVMTPVGDWIDVQPL